jgi:hypothetical protein
MAVQVRIEQIVTPNFNRFIWYLIKETYIII